MKFKTGNIVQHKGGNNAPMRITHIKDKDHIVVEYLYKTNYLGERVSAVPGKGVLEEVAEWQIEKWTPEETLKVDQFGNVSRLWRF